MGCVWPVVCIVLGGSAETTAVPGECVSQQEAASATNRALQECEDRGGAACDLEKAARDAAQNAVDACLARATPVPTPDPWAVPAPPPSPVAPAAAFGGERTAPNAFTDGLGAGRRDADDESTTGWTAAGFAGGCLLGPVGCLGVTATSYAEQTQVPSREENRMRSPEWQAGYRQGYGTEVKTRRSQAALLGGTFGTVVMIGGVLLLALVVSEAAEDAEDDDGSSAATSGIQLRF